MCSRTRTHTCPWQTTPADGQGSPERRSSYDLSEPARCRRRRPPRSGTARCTSGSRGTTRTTLAFRRRNSGHDPAGHEEDQRDEDQPVEHIGLGTGEHVEGEVGQELDDHAAERGADDRRDAADDEAGDQLDRSLEPEAVGGDGAGRRARSSRRRRPSRSALTAKAITLTRELLTPDEMAPISLSRMATVARPTRLRTRFDARRNITMAMSEDGDEDPGVVVEVTGDPGRRPPAEAVRHVALADGDGLAVAATGQALHLLDDRGEGQRDAQRHQREVEVADAQRRAGRRARRSANPMAPATGRVARKGHPWSATRIIVV